MTNEEFRPHFLRRLAEKDHELHQDPVALQVGLSGKIRPFMTDVRWLYNRLFSSNDIITTNITSKNEIDPLLLSEKLVTAGWSVLFSESHYMLEESDPKITELLIAHPAGLLINMGIDYRQVEENTKKHPINQSYEYLLLDAPQGEIPYIYSITILHGYNKPTDIIEELVKLSKECTRESSKGASIGIISADNGNYYVKNFSLENKTPSFDLPDLHYGDGFAEFHKNLVNRLGEITKGLVLFHGAPGTGKTQFIRVLLKDLAQINKSILYAPPSLSGSLTEPEMIEFISDWVMGESRDCILLIEDAEPLLEVRHGADGRSTGISNLLNMTDGLLNDILGLTVIATFNTELSKIDPALLRAQRLVARKEFKKLPKEQFEKLAAALNMELPNIPYPSTLAEFYAANSKNQVLTHAIHEERKIGFGK